MKAIEFTADVGRDHQIHLELPPGTPIGPARVLVLIPEADESELAWDRALSHDWSAELSDPREDIYSLEDGESIG